MGDKKVVRMPDYDFKTAGGHEGFHENKSMERLNQGKRKKSTGETGKSGQN